MLPPPTFLSWFHRKARPWAWVAACLLVPGGSWGAYVPGDVVRLARNETLLFKGEHFLPAPKGQEFTVFKQDAAKKTVYVAFIQKDGGVIAVTLPEEAVEAVPPDAWTLAQKGAEAFRDQKYELARKYFQQSGQDADFKAVAAGLIGRMEGLVGAARVAAQTVGEVKAAGGPGAEPQAAKWLGARKRFAESLEKGREASVELERAGYASLALWWDEGLDRLWAGLFGKPSEAVAEAKEGEMPATRLDRSGVQTRLNQAAFSLVRARQAMAVRRMIEASGYVTAGLEAESGNPLLKKLKAKVDEELKDAEERYRVASANRSGKHMMQGLLALERGLKYCVDHPGLAELKKQMSSALEEGTAPAITPAMLAAAKAPATKDSLEEGRKLYTNRCTECHDLEMLDSRSASGWARMVRSMAGKAHLKDQQESLIVAYLAAARDSLGAGK
ncbi:MAG: hypothetical protein RLZZ142_6 [Verrucomicrobiota bacterium]